MTTGPGIRFTYLEAQCPAACRPSEAGPGASRPEPALHPFQAPTAEPQAMDFLKLNQPSCPVAVRWQTVPKPATLIVQSLIIVRNAGHGPH